MSNGNSGNMKLVPAVCHQCGGIVEANRSKEKANCKYCGTPFLIDEAINNYNIQNASVKY